MDARVPLPRTLSLRYFKMNSRTRLTTALAMKELLVLIKCDNVFSFSSQIPGLSICRLQQHQSWHLGLLWRLAIMQGVTLYHLSLLQNMRHIAVLQLDPTWLQSSSIAEEVRWGQPGEECRCVMHWTCTKSLQLKWLYKTVSNVVACVMYSHVNLDRFDCYLLLYCQ